MDGVGDIIQLKVRLLRISPMIWRRGLVPSSITLRELHGVLQVAMGWEQLVAWVRIWGHLPLFPRDWVRLHKGPKSPTGFGYA